VKKLDFFGLAGNFFGAFFLFFGHEKIRDFSA